MSGLEDRPDLISGNRAAAAVGVEYHSLERPLTQTLRSQPRISVDGTIPVPRRTEVDLDGLAEHLG